MSVMPLDISGNPISPRDLAAHYRAVHAKLWTPPTQPPVKAKAPPSIVWQPSALAAKRRIKRGGGAVEKTIEFYPPQPMSSRDIVREVAFDNEMSVAEMKGESRKLKFSRARNEAMYRLRVEKQISYARIAHLVARLDHTAAINGILRFCEDTGAPLPDGMKVIKKFASLKKKAPVHNKYDFCVANP